VTVLDAQAVVALMLDEPAAPDVVAILRERDAVPMLSAISIAETADIMVRRSRCRVEDVEERLDWLAATGIEVVSIDERVARLAGILRSRHWHRDHRSVSLADCVVLATGMLNQEAIATADAALIGAARAEGHPVIVLPDSQGRRAP